MKKGKGKKPLKKILIISISVLAVLAAGVFLYCDALLNQIHYVKDESSAPVAVADYISHAETRNSSSKPGEPAVVNGLYHDDAIQNILVMGVDDYQKNDTGRSDSMMLVSIDTRHGKLKLTSFLRDLYLNIPGYSKNRINVAFSLGGAPLAVRTVESDFGISIDHYVTIEYSAFSKIVDRLNGVSITLSRDEADRINTYSGESAGKRVKEGICRLTGKQALYYCRIRTNATGEDFGRTERQRDFFSAIVSQWKSADPVTLNAAAWDVLNLVKTNMDKGQVAGLLANSLTYMKYPISQSHVPANHTYRFDDHVTIGSVPDNSVIIADMKQNSLIAAKFIYEDDFKFEDADSSADSSPK